MIREEYVEVGYIAKAHGIHGEVKAVFDVHDLNEYLSRKTIWIATKDQPPQILEISKLRLADKFVIAKFKDIDTRNDAEALVGSSMFIPESELPKLPQDQFYYYEVLGFTIEDEKYGTLGVLEDIVETGPQDLFVMRYKGKEVLIPPAKEIILSADKSQKILYTRLPEGLIALYLGEGE